MSFTIKFKTIFAVTSLNRQVMFAFTLVMQIGAF